MPRPRPYWPRLWLLGLNATVPPLFLWLRWPWWLLGSCFVLHNALALALAWPGCWLLGPLVRRFRPQGREVWLTLDDGPDGARSEELGRALQERGVRATFFVHGKRLEAQPETAAALRQAGHELANHTYTHPLRTFWLLGPRRLREEMEGAQRALAAGGAEAPRWFRPPLGLKNLFLHRELQRLGLLQVIWSARGRDGFRPQPERVVPRVLRRVRPGSIIVLHEGTPHSREIIMRVVEELQAQGYAFVIPRREQMEPRTG